jgi:membrane associated rhomboid family serine protease
MLIYLFVISLIPGVDFFGHFGSLVGGLLLGSAALARGDPELRKIQWASLGLFVLYTLMLLRIFF